MPENGEMATADGQMRDALQLMYIACVAGILVGCALPKRAPAYNLYELRPITDNDAFYVAPRTEHCDYSMSLGPSCGVL